MPIFISHTTADDDLANKVYKRLRNVHYITCYIDDMDKELEKNRGKASLTPLLVERLRKCDTLLAVVTEHTKMSWWVPFEIGTAREMPRAITSFTSLIDRSTAKGPEVLPEYLLEWPRLRTENDIDIFAQHYKKQSALLERSIEIGSYSQRVASMNDVRTFESTVMNSLGQSRY